MKREDLFEAIGQVDDDLLDDNAEPKRTTIFRYVTGFMTAAACLAVIVGTGVWAHTHQNPPVQTLPDDSTTESFTAAQTVTEPSTDSLAVLELSTSTVVETTAPSDSTTALQTTKLSTTTTKTTVETTTATTVSTETTVETKPEPTAAADWRTAYLSHIEEGELDGELTKNQLSYGLIYVDGDDVPELVVGADYIVFMYTWADGQLYTLMDGWGFGAMGNAGYQYIPRENKLFNHNSDYAGLIGNDTFFRIGAKHEFENYATLQCCYFNDANGNGDLDEDESMEYDPDNVTYWLGGTQITEEEANTYLDSLESYQDITPELSYDAITAQLSAN
ncbi:MAG: hypothetical protein II916_09430 [Oscillospiraceae bacterium]|nr:hypothetical protein [Oscillospiraceae bacterium]